MKRSSQLRQLLTGGDRRSIVHSNSARILIANDPSLVAELAALTNDEDWLVCQRALDLLEKIAQQDAEQIEPYKEVFIGPLADSDKWEIRLQIVRAIPLFTWVGADLSRARQILRENVTYPQIFVRAWALDSLAMFAGSDRFLRPVVERYLRQFEQSESKALQARARKIRERAG